MPNPVMVGSRTVRAFVTRFTPFPAIFSGAYNTFEGGSNTTTITTGNSGGTSGAPFDAVNIPSGGGAIFDSANAMHGSLAAKLTGGSPSGAAYLAYQSATLGTLADGYGRAYIKHTLTVGPPNLVVGLLSGAQKWAIKINVGRTISIVDGSSTTQATSTVTMTDGAYFRLDWHHNSSGQLVARIFLTPDSVTPDETITASANTASNVDEIRFQGSTTTGIIVYVDDIAAGLTSWPGPSVALAATAPPIGAQVI